MCILQISNLDINQNQSLLTVDHSNIKTNQTQIIDVKPINNSIVILRRIKVSISEIYLISEMHHGRQCD